MSVFSPRVYSPARPLRVCYFGTYRAGYTRNQIILKGLQAQPDVAVQVCHTQLWRGIEDRVAQASGGWFRPAFWRRVAAAYRELSRKHAALSDYDVMLIGYPGQLDAYLARRLAGGRPVALDILMSLYLVAEERGLTTRHPATGRLISLLEGGGLRQPDRLIAENSGYQAYIAGRYNLPDDRFRTVPHGADETVYYPRHVRPPDDCFRITYHGGYLPSHGMDTIIEAAALLRDAGECQFHFYGSGPEKARMLGRAAELALTNTTFHGFVSLDELLDGIASSHVCLGVFGTTRQSLFTVQNKIWESLAVGRPVVSGDAPTVREFLEDGREISLVPRENPEALAAALTILRDDPDRREAMARAGYERFMANNSTAAIGRRVRDVLVELVESRRND